MKFSIVERLAEVGAQKKGAEKALDQIRERAKDARVVMKLDVFVGNKPMTRITLNGEDDLQNVVLFLERISSAASSTLKGASVEDPEKPAKPETPEEAAARLEAENDAANEGTTGGP